MDKIGIVTIALENSYNYGNKLQAYALQEFLRQNGKRPEIVRYEPAYIKAADTSSKNCTKNRFMKLWTQDIVQTLDDAIRIIKRTIYHRKLNKLHNERINKFRNFATEYLCYTDKIFDEVSNLMELASGYDIWVTGSDQVWNPYYEGAYPFYYLNFAPKGKRISYAPSIAVEEIPEEIKSRIKEWLYQVDFLSIREPSGQDLLRREFGLEAKLVCDPVFLLDRQHWHSMAVPPTRTGRYFAVYILGKKTVEVKRKINCLKKKYKIEAVDIYSPDAVSSVFAGPEEFLGVIESAEFVLTDSFHGAAFSVIFEKTVITLERDAQHSMSSRIDGLFRTLQIQDRSFENIEKKPEEFIMDYSVPNEKLAELVRDSRGYLLTAIQSASKHTI